MQAEFINFNNIDITTIENDLLEYYKSVLPINGNAKNEHFFGQKDLVSIENSRKIIAQNLNCKTTELHFTTSLADSLLLNLKTIVSNTKVQKIIISAQFEKYFDSNSFENVQTLWFDYLNPNNEILDLIAKEQNALVVIPHYNLFTGEFYPLKKLMQTCENSKSLLLVDFSTTYGKIDIDLSANICHFAFFDFAVIAGVYGGVLYKISNIGFLQNDLTFVNYTNIPAILSMAYFAENSSKFKSLKLEKISSLKNYLIDKLNVVFNAGDIEIYKGSDVISGVTVVLPANEFSDSEYFSASYDLLLYKEKITANFLMKSNKNRQRPVINIFFSVHNTIEEIDCFLKIICKPYIKILKNGIGN